MVSNATGEGLMISNGSVNETTYKSMRLPQESRCNSLSCAPTRRRFWSPGNCLCSSPRSGFTGFGSVCVVHGHVQMSRKPHTYMHARSSTPLLTLVINRVPHWNRVQNSVVSVKEENEKNERERGSMRKKEESGTADHRQVPSWF